MPTILQQLTQLENDRQDLVDNLEEKGITGLSGDETFTELVPEVLNITGGAQNIYKVASIEERDDIENPEEGDVCLVYSNTQAPISNPPLAGTYTFPNTVTFASAISDEKYLNMLYTIRVGRVWVTKSVDITLNGTSCVILIVDEENEEEYTINYTSNDGITYTKTDGIDNYTLPDVEWGVEPFDVECSKFMLSGDISFNGIYVYENDDWNYLDININTTAGKILQGNKAYTSNGTITGTLVNDIYKVSSTQERDNLQNVQEGDICLVYQNEYVELTRDLEFNTFKVPNSFTFDESMAGAPSQYFMTFFVGINTYPLSLSLYGNTGTGALIYAHTDLNSPYIEYRVSNNVYTLGGSNTAIPETDYTLSKYIKLDSLVPDKEFRLLKKFIQPHIFNFEGIFIYENNQWNYLDIGIDTIASEIALGKKAYTSNGIITGTLE